MCLVLGVLIGRVGQQSVLLGSLECLAEQRGEDVSWNGFLVIRDGQASLGDVEDTSSGTSIIARIVQHTVGDSETFHQLGVELVAINGQAQGTCQAGLIENEGGVGEARVFGTVPEISVEEGLNASICWAPLLGELPPQFTLSGQDRGDHLDLLR